MESSESTSLTDVLLRINLYVICSYDIGPQTEESAILTVGGLCYSSCRRSNIRRVESCKNTSLTDLLLRRNFKIICSYDNGPQTEESAILTVGGLCYSSCRRSNIRRVESCESTSLMDVLLRINFKIICSYDNGPQTKESAIVTVGGLCKSFQSNTREVKSCESTSLTDVSLRINLK